MATNEPGQKMASLNQADIPYRVRWYLLGAYAGSGRVKRISRDLDVSLRKASRLLAGENITATDLQAMAKRYGYSFVQFIFAPLAPGGSDGFTQQAASLHDRRCALEAATDGGPLDVRPEPIRVVRVSLAAEPRMSLDGGWGSVARREGGEAAAPCADELTKAAE